MNFDGQDAVVLDMVLRDELTDWEYEVLVLNAAGWTQDEIAEELGTYQKSVSRCLKRIREKLKKVL